MERHVAKNDDTISRSPQGDVPRSVAGCLDHFEVGNRVAVLERATHLVAAARQVIGNSHEEIVGPRTHRCKHTGFRCSTIAIATPQRNRTLHAYDATCALVIGMRVREDVYSEWVLGELAQQASACQHGPGVDKDVAEDVDVQVVQRYQRKPMDAWRDLDQRHDRRRCRSVRFWPSTPIAALWPELATAADRRRLATTAGCQSWPRGPLPPATTLSRVLHY